MSDKPWKAYERSVAKDIPGGQRNPITGRSRGEKGDVENEEVNIEVKFRSKPLPQWIEDALDQADKAVEKSPKSQIPLVRLHVKNQRRENDVVVMRWGYLERVMGYGKWGE